MLPLPQHSLFSEKRSDSVQRLCVLKGMSVLCWKTAYKHARTEVFAVLSLPGGEAFLVQTWHMHVLNFFFFANA